MHHDINFNKTVMVAAHVTEIYGPVQALIRYLGRRMRESYVITHPLPLGIEFSPFSMPSYSEFKILREGKEYVVSRIRNIKQLSIFVFLQQLVLTFIFCFSAKRRFDLFIGVDNLNAFAGIILRKLGLVKIVVYYMIDYTPQRFRSGVVNFLYHLLDKFCVKKSNYVWNISRRIREIRRWQGLEAKRNLLVPVGINFDDIPSIIDDYTVSGKTLVYAGSLTESKGVHLAVEAMKDIVKMVPDAKLEIIGAGPCEKELRELARKEEFQNSVFFLGNMHESTLMQHLANCRVGIATYKNDSSSYTYYADPTKPKEYLACGLPIIITTISPAAEEVEKHRVGIVIDYDRNQFVKAAVALLTDDRLHKELRSNGLQYVSGMDWTNIFDEAISKVTAENTEKAYRNFETTHNGSVIRYRERLIESLQPFFYSPTVLDVGCGDGSVWACGLFSHISSYVVGVDIRKSRRWTKILSDNVDFVLADARFLPFKDKAFDATFTKDTLHHISQIHKALRELDRVTADFLLIIEANRFNPISYFHMVKALGHEHLTREAFFMSLKRSFSYEKILVTSKEAHVLPSDSTPLNSLFEFAEDFFEATPLLRRFSSYNLALIIKNGNLPLICENLKDWKSLNDELTACMSPT